ncbi:MAG TPA: sigma-70 family RNA polymerase sigma factor [Acidimicrobiales bacterium]|nr:sigma-70 family RNA polymerase sigma factor [Acidimicrobiales bacterium]
MTDGETGIATGSEGPALSESRKDVSDGALVVAIGRWQQQALAEVYRRHAGAVYGLASRILRDRALAEEVVQEVFLRLWARPENFDPERGRLRSFLLAQAHGRAVDLVRADVSRRRREEHSAFDPAAGGVDVDADVWREAVAGRVRTALSGLPENQRKALELAYFGGQTCREVATSLGEAEGTIKSRIRAGLRRMRAELSSAGIEPS